jgi:hypothetical protein
VRVCVQPLAITREIYLQQKKNERYELPLERYGNSYLSFFVVNKFRERHVMHIGVHLFIMGTHTKSAKTLALGCRGDKHILASWDENPLMWSVKTSGDSRCPLKEFSK